MVTFENRKLSSNEDEAKRKIQAAKETVELFKQNGRDITKVSELFEKTKKIYKEFIKDKPAEAEGVKQ